MDSSARPVSAISPDRLDRVAKDSQPAFEELYGQSSALLYTLAVRILGDRDKAVEKFAVSLESEGGRPQPSGEIYLVGQL
jgi:hypothetical protein